MVWEPIDHHAHRNQQHQQRSTQLRRRDRLPVELPGGGRAAGARGGGQQGGGRRVQDGVSGVLTVLTTGLGLGGRTSDGIGRIHPCVCSRSSIRKKTRAVYHKNWTRKKKKDKQARRHRPMLPVGPSLSRFFGFKRKNVPRPKKASWRQITAPSSISHPPIDPLLVQLDRHGCPNGAGRTAFQSLDLETRTSLLYRISVVVAVSQRTHTTSATICFFLFDARCQTSLPTRSIEQWRSPPNHRSNP